AATGRRGSGIEQLAERVELGAVGDLGERDIEHGDDVCRERVDRGRRPGTSRGERRREAAKPRVVGGELDPAAGERDDRMLAFGQRPWKPGDAAVLEPRVELVDERPQHVLAYRRRRWWW